MVQRLAKLKEPFGCDQPLSKTIPKPPAKPDSTGNPKLANLYFKEPRQRVETHRAANWTTSKTEIKVKLSSPKDGELEKCRGGELHICVAEEKKEKDKDTT